MKICPSREWLTCHGFLYIGSGLIHFPVTRLNPETFMNLKRFALATVLTLMPQLGHADSLIYKRANNQADYVKLEKLGEKKAEGLAINHPYKFTEEQMINMLRSLRYTRKNLFGSGEKIRFVYELEYINKYAPYLVEAFSKATPFDIVGWSVAQKRPLVIIRNDRLTQVQMWVVGQDLHIKFIKTEAKLEGDYQAQTIGDRMIAQAKGLRIELEPQEGQKFAPDNAQELVLDLNQDWDRIATNVEAEDAKLQAEIKERKSKYKRGAEASTAPISAAPIPATPATPVSVKDQKSAEARLSELKKLKDKGLISDQDYEKKKQEILQGI
jgi:hypothetical protein